MDLFKEYTILLDGTIIADKDGLTDVAILLYTIKADTTIYFIGSLSDFHIFKGYCVSQGFIGNYKYFPNLTAFNSTYISNGFRHFFSTPSYIEEYLSTIDI